VEEWPENEFLKTQRGRKLDGAKTQQPLKVSQLSSKSEGTSLSDFYCASAAVSCAIMWVRISFSLLRPSVLVSGKMGFSTELQGHGAHEVLLQRQDAELRLLDTMRRCLASKLKCDREFASGVAGVAVLANKRDWNDELQDSTLSKVSMFSLSLYRAAFVTFLSRPIRLGRKFWNFRRNRTNRQK